MFLVDSSVWIDFLRATETPQTRFLKQHLTSERVLVADLVVAEVLQGTRSDIEFATARDLLLALDVVTIVDVEVAVEAARLYRELRSLGVTPRKTIDTLIATRCIVDRIPLLFSDRDFEPFAAHFGLQSRLDFPGVQ